MKRLYIILLLVCFFSASAQLGGMGVDRRISRNQTPIVKKDAEKVDYIAEAVKKLHAELELDVFQQAVISDLMESTQAAEKKIYVMDIPDDAKIQKIVALRDELNAELLKVLTPPQVEKFEKLKAKHDKKNKKK